MPGVLRYLQSLSSGSATDQQLLESFIAHREESAFAALMHRHGPMVLSVCRRVLQHAHDAEDAFQATFLVLARRASAISKRGSVGSWLHGVAYRVATTAKTCNEHRQRRECRAGKLPIEQRSFEAAWRELQEVLDAELRRLPEVYRAPLILCYLEAKTHVEAAEQLGCPVGTLKSRLARARAELREGLTRRGLAMSAGAFAVTLAANTASAAVPRVLEEATADAARAFVAGQASIATSTRATMLADTMLRTTTVCMGKLVALAVTVVVVTSSVVGYQLSTIGHHAEPESEQAGPQQTLDKQQPHTDRFGDTLPPDAVARLGTSRFWCGTTGIQVAYSQDGSKILVANWSSVFVFEATTGRRLRQVRPSGNAGVNSMSLSPDGKLLAVGTNSHVNERKSSVQIFDMASGQLLRECIAAGRQQYLGVRFSPDGKLLASYSYPGKAIYLWDPATGKEIRHWPLASEHACFTFSSDSKALIAGDGKTIYFWDTANGRQVHAILDHPGVCLHRLAVSPDGKLLACQALANEPKGDYQGEKQVYVWDTSTGKRISRLEVAADIQTKLARHFANPTEIHDFQFGLDGKALSMVTKDGVMRIWDAAAGKELRRWDTGGWAGELTFSPDGKTLASLGGGNTVRFWDPATGKELREHPGHRKGFLFIALSPDGRTLASASSDPDVHLWDTAIGRELGQINAADMEMNAVQFSADGRTIITLSDDKNLQFWDAATRKRLGQLAAPFESGLRLHAASPDGKLYASSYEDKAGGNNIVLWDVSTGKNLRVLNRDSWWSGALGFSPDSRLVYSWSGAKQVFIWDVITGKLLRKFPAGVGQCYKGKFSPDGKWFACRSREEGLLLYSLASGSEACRFKIQDMDSADWGGLTFSPDGRMLAAGDPAGTIHLVELATCKLRRRLTGGHEAGIGGLSFSSDGAILVSGSEDTTAVVWDVNGRLNTKREPLREAELDACWTDLVSDDAGRAYQAIRKLVASPIEAVADLKNRLPPACAPKAERMAMLIADLDSETFAVRDAAMKELTKLGDAATPALRDALDKAPSAEVRRRIEGLLAKLERLGTSGEPLRQARAVEVLEHIGTAEARRLLAKLADGASGAWLTSEAKASLDRISKSHPAPRSKATPQ
jgi:RNA polymerase sigma factor (sigma-70 family)